MTETAEGSTAAKHGSTAWGSFIRRGPRASALLFAVLGVIALAATWFFAAAPLTAVEPNALFVDCGPALLGRPDPLPDPSCAGAYGGAIVASAVCVLLAVVAVGVTARALTRR